MVERVRRLAGAGVLWRYNYCISKIGICGVESMKNLEVAPNRRKWTRQAPANSFASVTSYNRLWTPGASSGRGRRRSCTGS